MWGFRATVNAEIVFSRLSAFDPIARVIARLVAARVADVLRHAAHKYPYAGELVTAKW